MFSCGFWLGCEVRGWEAVGKVKSWKQGRCMQDKLQSRMYGVIATLHASFGYGGVNVAFAEGKINPVRKVSAKG